ncbi:hypothetical protein [uncultured Cyclobacterium sp.]|uniref:hypothetical protein n=1 Tax=uncultured Cyclobacterium sp. TaxID=453820 RepID=UPI0030ECAF88|tara:strand:- start:88039 stop:89664 length:1626 start_codon:yes stop_codon:yes gene_type:complete
MRNVCIVILVGICFSIGNSCVSKKPTVVEKLDTKRGAILVEPQWKVKKNGVWLIAPLLGVAAGGAYGYYSDVFIGLESQEQNAAAYGGAGLLGGLLIAGGISKNTMKVKSVPVKTNDQNQWVRKYNRVVNENYHLLNPRDDGRLLLAPAKLAKDLSKVKKDYDSMILKMESNESMGWEELLSYRDFMRHDYFYFYPEEKKTFDDLVVSREKNAAFAMLHEKMEQIVQQPLNMVHVDQIAAFSNNHRELYSKISSDQKEKLKKMGDAYVSSVFASVFEVIREKELNNIAMDDFTSLVKVELLYQMIVKDAGEFGRLPIVGGMFLYMKKLKTEIVENNESELGEYFRSLTDRNHLIEKRALFLSNLESQPAVKRLESLTSRLEQKLIAEEKRKEEEMERMARLQAQKKIDDMMRETTASGEPTEAQMRFAIQSQVDLKNKKIEQISNTKLNKQNSMNLPLVLGGMFLKDAEVVLEYFRKITCEKSANRGGFVCDYSIKKSIKGGVSGNMINSMMGDIGAGMADIETGRFVKTDEGWMLVEIME